MKTSFLLALSFFMIMLKTVGQTLTPQIDKRVEIMSIVFRLAGNFEYNQNDATKYIADINTHFDKFRTDTLINYASYLGDELSIGFDAVMFMAVNLKLSNSVFTLQNNWKQDLDKRWTKKAALHFVTLLNQFYTKSKAEDFFLKEVSYYNKVIKAFDQVLLKFNQPWYYSYYGVKPKDNFTIIIGCSNGGANYGPSITLSKEVRQVFAIIGSSSFDNDGNPGFSGEKYLPTVVHEFNHSFINPLLHKYKNNIALKSSIQKILDTMRSEMERQAYAQWETVLNESIVRASVVRYLLANNSNNKQIAENEIKKQVNRGWLWTRELSSLLEKYEGDRSKYPTINEFYPTIISFFKSTADSISIIKEKYENTLPRVIFVEPFLNNAQNVDTSTKEMTIHFSEPLGKGVSVNYGNLGKENYPVKSIIGYINNNKALKLELSLKADTKYEMILTGEAFKNAEGAPLKTYIIKFKTK